MVSDLSTLMRREGLRRSAIRACQAMATLAISASPACSPAIAPAGGSASRAIARFETDDSEYASSVRRRIDAAWGGEFVAADGLTETKVFVSIGADGKLETAAIIWSSAGPELDEKAMAAVRRAAPFATPPQSSVHNGLATVVVAIRHPALPTTDTASASPVSGVRQPRRVTYDRSCKVSERVEPKPTLTTSDVLCTIKTHQHAVAACLHDHWRLSDRPEKIVLKWVIRPRGHIDEMAVETAVFRGTRVESCVLAEMARWQFPEFESGLIPVTFPFSTTD
jgi:TonB family protein